HTGEWEEKPNYFRVTVFGRQADACAQYLGKGRPVAIDGRLEWSSWESDGQKRKSIDIIADSVQFLASRDDNGGAAGRTGAGRDARGDVPIDTSDFDTSLTTTSFAGDEIPF
ncbi:MAG: single-stranded DNA-binding protein, partial [Solirubrobacteraceae bacterium]